MAYPHTPLVLRRHRLTGCFYLAARLRPVSITCPASLPVVGPFATASPSL